MPSQEIGLGKRLRNDLFVQWDVKPYDTIRYETLFNVRPKAEMSQLNLPHGTNN